MDDGQWAIKKQGNGWMLICKQLVPSKVRAAKQITQPDDNPEIIYVPVWKKPKSIDVILHAFMSQWFDKKISEAILKATGLKYTPCDVDE